MTALSFDDPEPQLWSRVSAGDAEAFGELFDRFRDRVYWQALRHTGSAHDAEDITALVFLEAWRNRMRVRVVDGSPLPWLLVTTNNVVRNHARTQRRHQRAMARVSPERDLPDFAPESDAHLDGAARREAVVEAFARLSPKEQDVVSLCVLEDMSLAQAAAALGVPTGTVKSRLSRAKARLLRLTTDLTDAGSVPGGVK